MSYFWNLSDHVDQGLVAERSTKSFWGTDHARLQHTDRATARNLRIHSGKDRKPRLWSHGAGDRSRVSDQIPKRGDVPSQGAGEEGSHHSRRVFRPRDSASRL